MNHRLVAMFRKKLESCNLSDYHGLKSPGLTCYLNSVLQVLFMTEDFRDAVKRCCAEDSTSIDSHLAKLFTDLEKKKAKTSGITRNLGIMDVYEQRDAAEYFEKILRQTHPEASKIFKGELNHRTRCHACKEKSDIRSYFWILPIAVKESSRRIFSVEKGLEAFFRGEKLCGENKIYCNRCKKKQETDFGCEITQSPEILTLLLKRFSFNDKLMCHVKLHCKVEVPKNVHIEKNTYDLYALVHHLGELTGGHYTAHIKSFQTQGWYLFDDDVVKGVRESLFGAEGESLRSNTAYLLMYRKVRKRPEDSDEGLLEAPCAASEEAERGETPDPRHPQKDEWGNYKQRSSGEVRETLRNFPHEPENHRRPQEVMNLKDGGRQVENGTVWETQRNNFVKSGTINVADGAAETKAVKNKGEIKHRTKAKQTKGAKSPKKVKEPWR